MNQTIHTCVYKEVINLCSICTRNVMYMSRDGVVLLHADLGESAPLLALLVALNRVANFEVFPIFKCDTTLCALAHFGNVFLLRLERRDCAWWYELAWRHHRDAVLGQHTGIDNLAVPIHLGLLATLQSSITDPAAYNFHRFAAANIDIKDLCRLSLTGNSGSNDGRQT